MHKLTCDRCDGGLLLDAPVRYEVTIEVKSGYDPLEVTREDLEKVEERMEEVLRQLEGVTEQEASDEVYWRRTFDLCATCQRAFLANPLGRPEGVC